MTYNVFSGTLNPTHSLTHCGQTVGRIQMKLGMQVGLGPGHIVLDGDPAPPPPKGHSSPHPIFGPYLLWPKGYMDQDATWYGGRPRPRRLCVQWMKTPLGMEVDLGPGHIVLDGVPALRKRGTAASPFGPCLFWPRSPISATAQLLFSSCKPFSRPL